MNPNLEPTQAQQDSSTTGRHIPALDGIRGLAILLVFMDHFLWSNPDVRGPWIVRLGSRVHGAGWIGVDLFFVLSGFLITGILYDTLKAPRFFRNFYARRALRIFPLYYGFLLLLFLGTLLTGGHWDSLAAIKLLTYTENLAIHPTGASINGTWFNINHFWSLAIEEQFYLLFSLFARFLRNRWLMFVSLSLAVLSCGLRVAFTVTGHAQDPAVWRLTLLHLDPIALGALLACSAGFLQWASRWRWVLLVAGAVGLWLPLPDGMGILAGGVAATGLVAMAATRSVPLLRSRVLTRLGKYSYAIYVLHPAWIVPPLAKKHPHSVPLMLGALLLGPVVSYGIGVLSWNVLEKHLLKYKRYFPYRFAPDGDSTENIVIEAA